MLQRLLVNLGVSLGPSRVGFARVALRGRLGAASVFVSAVFVALWLHARSMEHRLQAALALLAATALLGGCGDEGPSEPPAGPLVSYQRSGGIAGVLEELRVDADGGAVLVTGPGRDRATFTLTDQELEQLRSELEAADLTDPQGPPGDPGCSDCFAYRLEYGDHEVTFTDLDQPAESLLTVTGHLDALVAEHNRSLQPGG